jgi:peptide/nickel transport system permease protein
MLRFIVLRALLLVPVLVGASLVVFILITLAPGDPTATLLGPNASDEAREALRERLGLNDPLNVQYGNWLALVVQGDLGTSIEMQAPVLDVAIEKFLNTLILGAAGAILGCFLGIAAGVISAVHQNSLVDRFILLASIFGISMPPYWLSIVFIYGFAVHLGWFPTGQMYSVGGDQGLLDLLWHLALPAIAAAVVPATIMARVSRTAMLEVMRQDFITGLRAKGLPERAVLYRHAFRNALPPIVSMTGLQVGYLLLGSALFVEIVFTWPGLGLQTYNAIGARDFPMIAGIVLVSTLIFVIMNLIVDVCCAWLDPRVRTH